MNPLQLSLLLIPLPQAPPRPPQAPAPPPQAPASPSRLLRAVPEEALLVIATPAWDQIRSRAQENAWVAFAQDPVWKSVCETLTGAIDLETDLLQAFGPALLASIHGPVVLAVDVDAGGFGGLLLVDAGPGDREGVDALFDLAWNEAEVSARGQSVDYAGVSALRIPPGPGDPGALIFEKGGVYGALLHSSSKQLDERFHSVVDRLSGRDPSPGFLASPAYLAASKGLARPPVLQVAVNLERAVSRVLESSGVDEDTELFLGELGLLDLRWAFLDLDLGAGEDLSLRTGIEIPRETLLADFADLLGPLPVDLLRRIPASSTNVSLFNYDVWGAWNLFQEILANEAPEGFDALQAGLESIRAASNLDVEEELLSQITGRMAGFSMPVPPEELHETLSRMGLDAKGLLPESSGFILELDDGFTVQDGFDKVLLMLGGVVPVEEDGYGDWSVCELDAGMQRLCWSITDDALVYGASPTPLRAALDLASEPIPEDAGKHLESFRAIVAECGPEVSGLSVSDTRSVALGFLWGLEIGLQIAQTGMPPGVVVLPIGSGKLEFPSSDIVSQYFRGQLVQKISRTRDAIYVSIRAR